ncbi:PepSY domain-containing protein [Photobacterium sanguinicancri]|uniref:PepSY domain-containing protein n=1 Tax=Photobacterium sanguinicancri TaxID=875932 RepID=UPI000B127BE0|nr:PepSY domain-containing protein [Photobacterium sanguinicancri]
MKVSKIIKSLTLSTMLCWVTLVSATAAAAPTPRLEIDEDHDDFMEAVEHGLIQSFSALQSTVARQLHGRIIKVELEEDDDIWVYELKLLDPNNNIVKVEYDARTLSIIKISGRQLENIIKGTE